MKTNLLKKCQMIVRICAPATVFMFSACGGGTDPAPQTESQKVTQILTGSSGTWTPATSSGVTIDGVDVTQDLFPNFTITFHENTFTTTGNSPVWLREDTWRFKDQAARIIIRGQDQREITIVEISTSQLKLTLDWPETTTSGGRTGSLKGKHEFLLNK